MPPRAPHRAEVHRHRPSRPDRVATRERRHPQRVQLITGRRDHLLLSPLAAREHHLGPRASQRVGHRQRGHHVPGGAAGGDHDQRCFQPCEPWLLATRGCAGRSSSRPMSSALGS